MNELAFLPGVGPFADLHQGRIVGLGFGEAYRERNYNVPRNCVNTLRREKLPGSGTRAEPGSRGVSCFVARGQNQRASTVTNRFEWLPS